MIASGNYRKIFIILGINKRMCNQKKSRKCKDCEKYIFININQFFCEQLSWCKIENCLILKMSY